MESYIFIKENNGASSTLSLFIHGLASSKDEWFEMNGYTKGGNLTELLLNHNQAVLAVDLYGHGNYQADEKEFNASNISDEDWPKFVAQSVAKVAHITNEICSKHGYTRTNVFSYSGGAIIGIKVITFLNADVEQVFLASPPPERKYDDEYSLHNNTEILTKCNVFVYAGRKDEYIEQEDLDWFFEQLTCVSKKLCCYEAGHSLPITWVDDAIKEYLVFNSDTADTADTADFITH